MTKLLSKKAFGAMAGIGLTIGAAYGNAASAQDIVRYDRNCMVNTTPDGHQSKGQSDQLGDRKDANIQCRMGDWVMGAGYVLETPQFKPYVTKSGRIKREAYDTGTTTVLAGKDNGVNDGLTYGVYGRLGIYNTKALQDVFLKVHHLGGFKGMRMSPASTDESVFGGIAGRMGYTYEAANNLRFSFNAFGTAGTDQTALGANAFVSYLIDTDGFNAPTAGINGLPVPDNTGTGLYAGIQAYKEFYDVTTDKLGTNTDLQYTAILGAQFTYKAWTLQVGTNIPLTPEIKGVKEKPLHDYTARLQVSF